MTTKIQRQCGHTEKVWVEAGQRQMFESMPCSKCWADTRTVLYGTD